MPETPPADGSEPLAGFHHVGIQTDDLENSAAWYQEFLGLRPAWTLEKFSDLTRSRLPGIRRLMELVGGGMRVHLMERDGGTAPGPVPGENRTSFQHLCVAVEDPQGLAALRERWLGLYSCGRYAFALAEQPTEVVVDDDGVQSLYVYDVNGLEFEFTYVPTTSHGR